LDRKNEKKSEKYKKDKTFTIKKNKMTTMTIFQKCLYDSDGMTYTETSKSNRHFRLEQKLPI